MGREVTIRLVSIAETGYDQEAGLQFVKEMPGGTGMAFKWASPRTLSFWMKNTYIPLDIFFADSSGTIVKTDRMVPMSTRSVTSGGPCTIAIEVPAGSLDEHGILPGHKVRIDHQAKTATFHE